MMLQGQFYSFFLYFYIRRRETFNHLPRWLKEARTHSSKDMVIMLVGNKTDLEHKRTVSFEEGKKFAEDNGLIFLETSAKTAQNVEDAFKQTARNIYKHFVEDNKGNLGQHNGIKVGLQAPSSETVDLGASGSSSGGGCPC
eukprot:TRINITY_DN5520_c0_g2_i5.p1 TRINITY_DN5520_c0_g2~~TRINITY_DN5520_c0_g2_i5.p1  ORF type:complete len:141 (-),score=24.76 TRINITY_DN5520_c0_g2_i5:233-655(-)